ncbi:MAG: c-type cytochrome [Nitrincola lacisaponensis]|uniref:c-type cytochrome n=1 Tax=Nitrincola lacisaponensis TaxID=267850 RepID=UPI00391CECCE
MNKLAAKAASALCTLGLSVALATTVYAAVDRDAIIERIKPHGNICVEGDETCGLGAPVASASASAARSGEEVYNRFCAACHNTGLLDSPKFGSGQMSARAEEKGLDGLLANSISGINAMPPKGTCNDCSDDELEATIQYMIDSE